MTVDANQHEGDCRPHLKSEESLFERCHWFYALCREHLFRDHTAQIRSAIFPSGDPVEGTRILELGCGPGVYACRLAKEFPQIRAMGIDLSRSLLRRARVRAAGLRLQNCNFVEGDAQALAEESNSVDAVIVSRLLLIVPNKEAVLSEVFRVLRPGGRCFIAEPVSSFATRFPLRAMWLLAYVLNGHCERLREPQEAVGMRSLDFLKLVHSSPWASVEILQEDRYQCAICSKSGSRVDASWSAA